MKRKILVFFTFLLSIISSSIVFAKNNKEILNSTWIIVFFLIAIIIIILFLRFHDKKNIDRIINEENELIKLEKYIMECKMKGLKKDEIKKLLKQKNISKEIMRKLLI